MTASIAPSAAPQGHTRPQRVRLLGGDVDAVTPAQVLAFADECIAAGGSAVIANHNLHSLYLLRRDPQMSALYAMADLIEVDSYPLVAWARLLGRPIRAEHRATYLDWREAFWALACARGWRVFYLGGAPTVARQGAEAIRRRWPSAVIEVRDGFFDMNDPAQAGLVLETIQAWRPDVLLVGMGMPRQETWILRNHHALPPCVTLPVGAAFDYEAGAVPTPPRWTGPLGLEWLYRFATDPRRLFTRYFIEPWSLIGPALADLKQGRKSHAPQSSP